MRIASENSVRVWDRFVRSFHWALVTAFAVAWFFTDPRWLHKGAGYATLALVAARVVWGFKGSAAARFANFVPSPRRLWRYLAAVLRGREPRHLGHNPAGAVMILFLMAAVAGIGVTGFLMGTDAYWGNETVENLHLWLVDGTLAAVAVHVAANLYGSWHHGENLIQSMVTGDKPLQIPGHPAGTPPDTVVASNPASVFMPDFPATPNSAEGTIRPHSP
jgi:cytochrome b